MSIDLNDPSTWPTDMDELTNIAVQEAPPDDGTPAPSYVTDKEPKPVTASEETLEEGTPGDQEPPAKAAKEEAAPAPEELVIDGIPVLTKDGKHQIPFEVFAKHRTDAQRYRQELEAAKEAARVREEEFRKQLSALQSKPSEANPPNPPPPPPKFELPDAEAIEAQAQKLEEDWGPEHAQMYRDMMEQKRVLADISSQLSEKDETLQQLRQAVDTRSKIEAKSQEDLIQAAIDANPTLLAWQTDESSPWYDRAVEVHNLLMNSDPDFAKLSYEERFAQLPERVRGVYPNAPLIKQPPAEQAIREAAAKKAEAVAAKTPVTHTDLAIPGDTQERSQLKKLEDMDEGALMDMFAKMTDEEQQSFFAALA